MEEYYVRSRMQKVLTFYLNAFKSYPIVKIPNEGDTYTYDIHPWRTIVHDGINSVVSKNTICPLPSAPEVFPISIWGVTDIDTTLKDTLWKCACNWLYSLRHSTPELYVGIRFTKRNWDIFSWEMRRGKKGEKEVKIRDKERRKKTWSKEWPRMRKSSIILEHL